MLLDWALWCISRAINFFLSRSSLGSTAMESCWLPELKYAIFSRTGCKTKKLHISNQLIDSLLLTYCPKSCDKEKLSIPLEPHQNAQSSEIFRQKIETAVIFYLLANPGETAYLSVRDRDLSNAAWLVKFRPRKVAVHTFLGWSQAGLLRRPSRRNYQKP